MMKALDAHQKYQDKSYQDRRKYVDYANIASVYNEINIDSTEHYALLSLKYDNVSKLKNAEFSNYLVLGNVNLVRKNYPRAIYYLKKLRILNKILIISIVRFYTTILLKLIKTTESQIVPRYMKTKKTF
jgi:hypothetical protein